MVRRSTLCVFGSFVGENRSIWIRRGRVTGRGDIVCNGLGEGVIEGIHAELSDEENHPRYENREIEVRATAYTGRLIHVNPGTIYIKPRFRVIEALKFARPVSETEAGSASRNPVPNKVGTRDLRANLRMEPI